jgi:hypothetical protein
MFGSVCCDQLLNPDKSSLVDCHQLILLYQFFSAIAGISLRIIRSD